MVSISRAGFNNTLGHIKHDYEGYIKRNFTNKNRVLQLSPERFNVCENLGSHVGERRLIRVRT